MSGRVDDLEATRAHLATRRLGRSLEVLGETDSTMDDARRSLEAGAGDGHVVVADTQRAGRGTHGRVWSSPGGQDLYFSLVARPDVPIDVLPTMTLAVGLGVARAIAGYVGEPRTRIKWPNDVLVDGRKCAGILVESRALDGAVDAVIVGIGVNCNRREFDASAAPTPTSLALAVGAPVARGEVLARLLAEIETALDDWQRQGPAPTAAAVELRLAYVGVPVTLDGRPVELLGVDADGCLRIRADGRVAHVSAGRLEPA